jgi:hypothetical protein
MQFLRQGNCQETFGKPNTAQEKLHIEASISRNACYRLADTQLQHLLLAIVDLFFLEFSKHRIEYTN